MVIRRWLGRVLVAAAFTSALAFLITPPGYLTRQFQAYPLWIAGQLLAVFLVAFIVVLLLEKLIAWAARGHRTLRAGGVLSFVTGIVSGLCALTLWLAFVSVPVAPVGLVSAFFVLRSEVARGEGHSLVNIAGITLNILALGTFISQVITATVWR